MLLLTYFELNENMPVPERLSIAGKLTTSGLFPSKSVKILRWDVTPDAWGILLMEADSAVDAALALDCWRIAGAGFFKHTKTAPAIPLTEGISPWEEAVKAIGGV